MTTAPTRYQTTDLAVAAFLLARGHALLGLERVGQQGTFVFPAGAADDARAYFAGATVPAVTFARALKAAKKALHGR